MLTNETLRAIVHGEVLLGMNDVRPMAEDLLRLRAIRDAGDSEVSALAAELVNFISEQQDRIKVLIHADELARKLRDIAIARGQQLREAQVEIERLRMAVGCATTIKGDMVMRGDDPLGMMQEVCSYVDTLTAERDEFEDLLDSIPAPELNEEWIKLTGEMECLRNDLREAREEKKADMEAIDCLAGDVERLTAERDEARKELAALRSAPGMEEVDAILNDVNSSVFANQERLSNIARRAIASRDEVVGLLDHILSCIITVRQENTPEWMEYIVEEVNKVNKAMGDSDRVELSRGDIVIVKGGSEIVEGNHA